MTAAQIQGKEAREATHRHIMKYSRMRVIAANVKNTILSITRSLLIFGASLRNKNTQENSKLQSILLRSIYSYRTQNS